KTGTISMRIVRQLVDDGSVHDKSRHTGIGEQPVDHDDRRLILRSNRPETVAGADSKAGENRVAVWDIRKVHLPQQLHPFRQPGLIPKSEQGCLFHRTHYLLHFQSKSPLSVSE